MQADWLADARLSSGSSSSARVVYPFNGSVADYVQPKTIARNRLSSLRNRHDIPRRDDLIPADRSLRADRLS